MIERLLVPLSYTIIIKNIKQISNIVQMRLFIKYLNIIFFPQSKLGHFWVNQQSIVTHIWELTGAWIFYQQWGEWPSGLRRCNQNRKVTSSNPVRLRQFKPRKLGLGTQLRYEAPGRLRESQICKSTVINIRWVRLLPWLWPKVGRGAA